MRWVMLFFFLFPLLVACQMDPSSEPSTTNKRQAAQSNVALGLSYLEAGQFVLAKQKLLHAVALDPHSSEAQDALGHFWAQIGENDLARQAYRKAIALHPKGREYNHYGVFLCRNKAFEEAEQQFLKALADPHYLETADTLENLGLCALMVPDPEKAALYFKRALNQDPGRSTAVLELERLGYNGGRVN